MAATTVLAACGGADDSADSSTGSNSLIAPEKSAAEDVYAYDSAVAATGMPTGERDLIISMGIGLESADVARTVAVIEGAVAAAGGMITSSDVGRYDAASSEGWANMVVRIPPDRLESFVGGLDKPETGATVTSVSRSTADVTDQVVELDVRIENQRESVEAIRRLMVDATDLADVVMLERELNQRQTDLEVMVAQQTSLADLVELATISIDVYHPGSAPEPDPGLIDGFTDGWSAFVSIGTRLVYLLAALSPFIGLVLVVGLIFFSRRRRR